MYQALYRKWRPMSFEDVVSQPHITTTLRNQIISGKTAHAYLFTGSRGTGKTTCARIFAKAVNCLNADGGSPCLNCDICRCADSETLGDIVEIDAASNTGVEDIRELRESTIYMPERCRFKVYIIDEVHMLSASAFNALLKILEEPPEYVKFILATTEIHKVPVTVVSRCQRFDFRRVRPEDIRDRLLYIASQEEFTLDRAAAELIAKLADGGMRDALSLLDQCVAYSRDVVEETVAAAAGIAGRDKLLGLVDCFAEHDAAGAIDIISELYGMSKDMRRLLEELISHMRDVMLAKSVRDDGVFNCLPDEVPRIRKEAEKLQLAEILRMIDILQQCAERMPKVAAKRVEMEMCAVKICCGEQTKEQSPSSAGLASVEKRLLRLEGQVQGMAAQEKTPAASVPSVPSVPYESLVPQKQSPLPEPAETKTDLSKLRPEDFKRLDCWNELIDALSQRDMALAGFLDRSAAFVYENVLLLVVDNDFFLKMFKETKCAEPLSQILKERFGRSFVIRVRSARNVNPADRENPVNKLLERAKSADIAVEIKD